ncbi:MAG TPA: ArsA family ATPase [Nocardioidaceae bacterium]|nr:ArsA family ATPase [Nocardioidaceae bacterium]
MRTILFTGKGGVGKTTAAAGTATAAAAAGHRTLVLSTDAAHSLGDAFGEPIGSEPTEVAPLLFVQQVDAQRRFEQSWAEVQGYLLTILDAAGVDRITAEELTVIPVAEEVLALLEVRTHALSGQWDVLVVDCAPTAETLRLLALPEALGWYMERVFPMRGKILKAISPVIKKATGVPLPQDSVFDAIERLHADLQQVHQILTGKDSSVRLVLTPETMVVAEARRALTTLSLFGFTVDGVVANRVFPDAGSDQWREQWVEAQSAVLSEVDQSFEGLPVWRSPYRPREPVGVSELAAFAASAYGDDDPLAAPSGEGPMTITRTPRGTVLRIALPFAAKSDIDLARHGDELVVTVGSYRRILALPTALRAHEIAGARIEDGVLKVRFRPDQSEHTLGEGLDD